MFRRRGAGVSPCFAGGEPAVGPCFAGGEPASVRVSPAGSWPLESHPAAESDGPLAAARTLLGVLGARGGSWRD